ncbi:hypothetical protein JVU11DRAFT_4724 [Chiua virens]|nr:hypothetical protein JVU11DRAFT_4724 [Chiua virens]
MDDDVDMDAPQISTLREESTPPPARGSKLRVKLLVGDKKGTGKSSSPSVPLRHGRPPHRTQLSRSPNRTPSTAAPVASVSAGTKRKAPPKKPSRPRKNDKQDKEDKKPDEPQEPPENELLSQRNPRPKKKAAPRKTTAAPKPKIKVPPKGAKALAVPPAEDAAMSETHTITAPSSPFPVSRGPSPEPEEAEPPPPPAPAPETEQPGETTPLPLPPPPKIGTGFAPVQPLDRTGAKARQWRIANREIRGIAGGRWFARSWVGDKESDFANALATAATNAKVTESDKVAVPKAVTSISAPALGKAGKSKAARGSAGISAAPSRSGSIVPDHELHTPKAPTKMRNIITGPASEAGEAGDEPEMVAPEPPSISMAS